MQNHTNATSKPAFKAARKKTVALFLLLLGTPIFSCCSRGPTRDAPSRDGGVAPVPSQEGNLAKKRVKADEIEVGNLPPEARLTLQLIKRGGPFPYAKDGTVFGNRERLLPGNPRSYYHEFTVKTPGARDRGGRRIIAGNNGEYYYTDDHYRSFKRIRE